MTLADCNAAGPGDLDQDDAWEGYMEEVGALADEIDNLPGHVDERDGEEGPVELTDSESEEI